MALSHIDCCVMYF